MERGTTEQLRTCWHSTPWFLLYPSPHQVSLCPVLAHLTCTLPGHSRAPLPPSIPGRAAGAVGRQPEGTGPAPTVPKQPASASLSVTRDKPSALGQHQEAEAREKKRREVWTLFAVGPGAHPQGLHQPCKAPGDTSGTSCRAGMGAASLRWQGVRAVLEGETGGFPLIIYSLSLGNQAASTAKLSLLVPGPFEAGGCLSSLSGCAAPAPSMSQLGRAGGSAQRPTHVGQP